MDIPVLFAINPITSTSDRLYKQRDHLFTFLPLDQRALFTAHVKHGLAERQLRPAVIARKISCGNKTQKGAPYLAG